MQGQPITVYRDDIEAQSRPGCRDLGEILTHGS